MRFYRSFFSHLPKEKVAKVYRTLKAIYAQEDLAAAKDKVQAAVEKLRGMRLNGAAELLEKIIG